MALSSFCYVIGVVELLIGIPMLVRGQRTAQWILDFKAQEMLLRVIAAVFLVLAVLVLVENARVDTSVAGLMRLVAWLTAIKCLAICWFPQWHRSVREWMFAGKTMRYVLGALAVIFGVLFVAAGRTLQ